MVLSKDERLTVLLAELSALQDRFIKYDDLIWKSRSWSIALVAAFLGWALSAENGPIAESNLLLSAVYIPILFWLQEGLLRFAYVNKFVVRYRRLRDALNDQSAAWDDVPTYDLTNNVEGRKERLSRLPFAFFRLEQIVFFLSLALAPLGLFCLSK